MTPVKLRRLTQHLAKMRPAAEQLSVSNPSIYSVLICRLGCQTTLNVTLYLEHVVKVTTPKSRTSWPVAASPWCPPILINVKGRVVPVL